MISIIGEMGRLFNSRSLASNFGHTNGVNQAQLGQPTSMFNHQQGFTLQPNPLKWSLPTLAHSVQRATFALLA